MSVLAPKPIAVEPAPLVADNQTGERIGDRRGPLRPDHLVTARKRMRGSLVAHAFFGLDATIAGLAALACALPARGAFDPLILALADLPQLSVALTLLIALRAARAYGFRARERAWAHLARVAAALAGAAVAVTAGCQLAAAPPPLAQALSWQMAISAVLLLAAHGAWIALVRRWRRRGLLTPNLVIVGATDSARRLIENALRGGEAAVLGVFDDRHARAPSHIAGVPVLGDLQTLVGHRIMPFVDRVVIAVDPAARSRIGAMVKRLEELPNDISLIVDWGAADHAGALDRLADAPLSSLSGQAKAHRRLLLKRAQDLAFGTLALVLATPLMLGIALAVKLDSPGPVLFRQKRQGFNNETITVWKFRSMRHDQRDEKAHKQVRYDDPRITRVGRIIRRTSLDELPQLFNVLAGEMSLVGPRPHAPEMRTGQTLSAQLVARYAHRHRMKPGMTGWAAVHGSRGPVDTPELVRQRVALDMDYIERQSFWLDLYIMAMTVPCLIGDKLTLR